MADNKRNSNAGKAAAAKSAARNDLDSLSKAIGARIRLTLAQNTTVEGSLFTACPITNLVAINTSAPSAATPSNGLHPGDFHIIPISSIEHFQILSLATTPDGASTSLPALTKADFAALKAREDGAIKEMRERDANRGKGVSKEGQEIYDHFKRTLPTRWHGTTIVVNDSLLVEAPYRAENIKAPKEKQAQIPQIKRVLEGYHAKKRRAQSPLPQAQPPPPQQQEKSNTQSQTARTPVATPIPQRKGG